mgnify:CR=1 FL=1
MDNPNVNAILDAVIRAEREAAELIMHAHGILAEAKTGHRDVVTEYDKRVQALLMELQNNTEYLNRMAGMLGPDAIAEAAKMPSQALRMVLVVFIVVPIACAYPFFQRYIVSGLTVGSVKG